jgi:dTDP-glucose 4,6-dehydratase
MSRSDFWKNKNVLVTGAGGFIGSHLVETLASAGANVRAMVRYTSSGSIGWLADSYFGADPKPFQIVRGDLRDAEFIRGAVKGQDYVFHLGAMISIPYSYLSTYEAASSNLMGTLSVLQACRDSQVRRMIHTSTSEVYGTAQYVPIDEKHPLQGQSPYSASKIGADKLAESYFNAFGVPVTTVRPFNTYGPRQSARAVIPTVLVQLLSGRPLKLGSLDPTRDFTFVSDTVRGMMMAAESDKTLGKTVNLGTKSEISIGDLVQKINGIVGKSAHAERDQQRIRPANSEVERLLSNNDLMRELTGWAPQVSLDEGLRKTADWLGRHLDSYRLAQTEYVV